MNHSNYSAPERQQGKQDVKQDMWSLGMILFSLVSLQNGFEYKDMQSTSSIGYIKRLLSDITKVILTYIINLIFTAK
jgi:serine/threonine protein kinase